MLVDFGICGPLPFLILTPVTRAQNAVYPETCLRLTQEYSFSLFYFTVIFSKLVLLILLSGLGISLQQAVNPLSLSACQMLNWHRLPPLCVFLPGYFWHAITLEWRSPSRVHLSVVCTIEVIITVL